MSVGAPTQHSSSNQMFPGSEQNGGHLHLHPYVHHGYPDPPPPAPPPLSTGSQMPSSTTNSYPDPPHTYYPSNNIPPMVPTKGGSDDVSDLSSSGQHSLPDHQSHSINGRSRYMGPELDAIKSKLEALKVEDKLTHNDILYEERSRHGEDKYSVQQQTRSGSTHARINFVEKL